jgi:Protein of unknown function (DUF3489)
MGRRLFETEEPMSKTITAPEVTEAEASLEEGQAISESSPALKTRLANRTRNRSVSRKASRSKKQPASSCTKQDAVLQMLRQQPRVSIDDIAIKSGWQPHSVRGFLSGVVRKKLDLPLVSEVGKDGVRRYHLAPLKLAKT